MFCDITKVVTSLEAVRVLCKTEENGEHRKRTMQIMFENMLMMASMIRRGDSSDSSNCVTNGGSYALEAMQYVFSRFSKESQAAMVTSLDERSRDWQSDIDFGHAEKESSKEFLEVSKEFLEVSKESTNEFLELSVKRYRRITCLHLSVMFKKDVSPELAMDHMLEMFDNQADRAKIEAYKVARIEAFSRGRQELRNRLSELPELAEEYDFLLSSDDEEDTLNGDDGNSDASEDIQNSPALD